MELKINEIIENFKEKFPEKKIIYMAEIGSKGRGLSNEDSDSDIGIIYLPTIKRLYSTSRGNQAHHYKYDDGTDITAYDLEKIMVLFKKTKPAVMEWFFSQKIYYNLLGEDLECFKQLYIDFYEKDIFLNHHGRVGLRGGRTKRKRQYKFKRLLWSYLSLEGILRNDVFTFDYQSILKEVITEDTEYAESIRAHKDKDRILSPHEIKLFGNYFNTFKLKKIHTKHNKNKKIKAIDKLMYKVYHKIMKW